MAITTNDIFVGGKSHLGWRQLTVITLGNGIVSIPGWNLRMSNSAFLSLFILQFNTSFLLVLALEILMKSVFNLGNSSAFEFRDLRDVRPSWAELFILCEKQVVLLGGPLFALDIRIEHVDPSFTALSTDPVREVVSDLSPFLGSVLPHLLPEDLILLRRPQGVVLGLVDLSVFYFLPSLEAADLSFGGHELADPVPSIVTILLDKPVQNEIFHLGPDLFLLKCLGFPLVGFGRTSQGSISS